MSVQSFERLYESPDDDIKSIVDTLPQSAQHSLDMEIFQFSDLQLAHAIVATAQRGVHIRAMVDHRQSQTPTGQGAIQMLVDASVDNPISVKIVESRLGFIDHSKRIVIDGADGPLADTSSVFWGSYNFSDSAQKEVNCAEWTNDAAKVSFHMQAFERNWRENRQNQVWQLTPTPRSP